jgi:hypothetical protein
MGAAHIAYRVLCLSVVYGASGAARSKEPRQAIVDQPKGGVEKRKSSGQPDNKSLGSKGLIAIARRFLVVLLKSGPLERCIRNASEICSNVCNPRFVVWS